jgi:hypothetical protein
MENEQRRQESVSRTEQYVALALTLFFTSAALVVMVRVPLRPAPLREEAPQAPLRMPGPVDPPRWGKCTGYAALDEEGRKRLRYVCDEEPPRLGPKDPLKDPKGPGQGRVRRGDPPSDF